MALPASYEPNHFAKVLFIGAFVQSLAYIMLVYLLSKKIPKIKKIWTVIILFLFSIETYTYFFFESRFNPNILTLILQTSWQEIKEFFVVFVFNYKLLITLLLFVPVIICLWCLIFRNEKVIVIKNIILSKYLILLLIIIGISINYIPLPFPIGQNTVNELFLSVDFVSEKHGELELMEKMFDKVKIIHTPSQKDAPVIVFIIGESFNKHHSSLYGYSLPTSPLLKSELEKGHLFVYYHAYTPTNGTNYAMRYLFSLQSCNSDDKDGDCVLMPYIFKKAGYRVAYFDNQYTRSSGGALDYSCGYFLNPHDINNRCFDYRNTTTVEYDGDFIDAEKNHLLTSEKSLNIIHLMGQHFDAGSRYPSNFSRFKSDDILRPDLEDSERQKVAEYDNATLYNDGVVSKIIDYFREKDAIIVYLSDHGEQIYDGIQHYFGRTFGSIKDSETIHHVYEVPFMIWCSHSFKEKHSHLFHCIRQSVSNRICIDDVAYLLFDLASIDFNYHQKNRSYISSDYHSHQTLFQ